MSSHKGIEHTKLVELNSKVIRWFSEEPREITTTKYDTGNSKSEELVDGHLGIFVIGLTISSPHSRVSLRAEEVATS